MDAAHGPPGQPAYRGSSPQTTQTALELRTPNQNVMIHTLALKEIFSRLRFVLTDEATSSLLGRELYQLGTFLHDFRWSPLLYKLLN